MSIDVYAADMVAKAKLVVVRLLGGKAYWNYGVETFFARAEENGVQLVFLPGDDKPDPYCRIFDAGSRRLTIASGYFCWRADLKTAPPP